MVVKVKVFVFVKVFHRSEATSGMQYVALYGFLFVTLVWKVVVQMSKSVKFYLFSSLYHSNSGVGTAVASHCRVPMRPT